MTRKVREILGALLIVGMLLSFYFPPISGGVAPMGPPPPNGDWTVSDNTAINDTTIVVNGNLTITASGILELNNVTMYMNGNISVEGDLILRNVTLLMDSPENGSYGIFVESGGLMYIFDYDGDPASDDGSVITSGTKDGRHRYTFWVKSGSKFRMENSVLQECGYGQGDFWGDHTKGLFIETSNVHIKNVTVNKTRNGIFFNSSSSTNNLIYNCSFLSSTSGELTSHYGSGALSLMISSNNTISRCKFYNFYSGIYTWDSNNNTIEGCLFENSDTSIDLSKNNKMIYILNSKNIQILNGSGKMFYYGLRFRYYSDNIYVNNFTIESAFSGITIQRSSNITLENINITGLDAQLTGGLVPAGITNLQQVINLKCINITIIGSDAVGITWGYNQSVSKDFYFKNCYFDVDLPPLFAVYWESTNPFKVPWTIKDVLFEDSYFKSRSYTFESFYKLHNWKFKNSTFVKNGTDYRNTFPKSNIGIWNDALNISFDKCRFDYTGDLSSRSDAFVISPKIYDGGGVFEIDFNNSILTNHKNGIDIHKDSNYPASSLTINNSSIYDNVQYGLNLSGGGIHVNITNSNISNNGNNGVHLDLSNYESEVILKNTTILNNGGNGIFVDGSIDVNIYNCTISKNGEDGIFLIETNMDIYNSEVSYNQERGVVLDSTTGNIWGSLNGNTIHNNSYEGIYQIGKFSHQKIENNLIKDNGIISGNQIYATSTTLTLNNNEITSSNINSLNTHIYAYDAQLKLDENNITTSHDYLMNSAIALLDCTWIGIDYNIISGNFTDSIIEIKHPKTIYDSDRDPYCYYIDDNMLLNYNTHDKSYGVYVYHQDKILSFQARIKRNTITSRNNKGTGIYLWSDIEPDGFNDIYNNTISNWNIGLEMNFTYERNETLNKNLYERFGIERNTFKQNNYGFISDASDAGIINNIIKDSKVCGILARGKEKYPLINNKFINNQIGIAVEGSVELIDNTFKGNDKCIEIEGGEIHTYNNDIIENNIVYAFNNTRSKLIILKEDNVKDNNIVIFSENSELYFNNNNLHFENNNISVYLVNSTLNIYNFTKKNMLKNFVLDDTSTCNVINSIMDEEEIEILDDDSILKKQWFLNLSIINGTAQPLSDILVVIKDHNGHEVFNRTTNETGKFEWINLSSMEWTHSGLNDPNPHKVILTKPGYGTTSNDLNISDNTNSTFRAYKLSEIITSLKAFDTPNDQGGSITLKWDSIPILNFGRINIYYDTEKIDNIRSAIYVTSIQNQTIESIVISQIKGLPLENGEKYYFALTVEDDTGYYDDNIANCSNFVIPLDNIIPNSTRILSAYDTPNDNGGSITVTWDPSNAVDFDRYEIFCLSESDKISNEFEIINITPQVIVWMINDTEILISDLINNNSYYFAIFVYDVNGNVNLSYSLYGPVSPIDNLPPIINKGISYPLYTDLLEFNADGKKNFRIYLDTKDIVIISWYLDNLFYKSGTEYNLTLEMSGLSYGNHSLTVVVEEQNGLTDSLTWNFTVLKPIAGSTGENIDFQIMIWLIIVFILIIVGIISIISFNRFQRYQEINRTLRTISEMDSIKISEMITNKREQGDKFALEKLLDGIPSMHKIFPNSWINIRINYFHG
jgi:parallel beta-helix repeat protein